MGRYTVIKSNYDQDTELACSGILAQAIHKTIGDERFEEWCMVLTHSDVCNVMVEMNQLIEIPISLDYQKVSAREIGCRKLGILMLWYHESVNTQTDTLTFC